ncbi:MAG: ABC transporter ATP-binding protein/permease [Anaerolineae bacterium]|nr:ABC transporter ATP-binding protein/permease [Anaerolineae bacterium]
MTADLIKRLLFYPGKYHWFLWGAGLSAGLSVLTSLIGPLLIGQAVDHMMGAGRVDFDYLGRSLLVLAVIYSGGGLAGWLLIYLTNQVAYRSVNDLRRDLFARVNNLPLKFFDGTPHGDTISRFVNDMDAISDGLLQGLATLLTGVFTIVGAIVFMLTINWLMTAVVLFSAPVSYFVARYITHSSQRMFKTQAKNLGQLNGYIEEMIGGQKVVQAFTYQDRSYQKFEDINRVLYDVGVKAQFYSSLTNPSTRLVNNLTYAVVGIIGSLAVIFGSISVGGISSFLIYSSLFAKPFNEITGVLSQLQATLASAQRIFEVLDLSPEAADALNELKVQPGEGTVSFERVNFSYVPGQNLINDFNLEIKAGSNIAIVGHTGAGKTTLVNLLMRFYDINSGVIKIEGVPINEVNRDSLRINFGMVPQDAWLFNGSIRDNISYGKPDATDEEIINAARAVDAHAFIKRLPQAYDTVIDDAGENLSQGQKQLLTIARVMLVNPPLLILDEATSSIDTRTEQRIQKAFLKLSAGKTCFIIAHRLSTIREADLILVMDKGQVVESGRHDQLLNQGGYYAKLYESQFAPLDA